MAEYLIQDTTLVNIADAIRAKTGKTDMILVSNIASEIAGISTDAELNFEVVGGTTEPTNPSENTIWVNTDTDITNWIFSENNPYIAYKDVELTEGLSYGLGYITNTGSISSQTASNPELYTQDYIPVKYGTAYNYEYTVSATKNMWLAIVEYTGNYTFKTRNVVVNSVSGTHQTGTYTPSSSDVTAVRLSWRTFPSTTYTISFIEPNVEYTVGEVDGGTVWISTEYNSEIKFNALKENGIYVYPSFAMQYIGSEWVTKTLKLYQDGAWTSLWDGYLYNSGDECIDVTGGWGTAYKSGISSDLKGTLTKNADHLYLASDAYEEQVWAKTANKINTRGRSKLEVAVNSFTSSSYGPTRKFGLSDGTSWNGANNMIASTSITSTGTFYLDLSAIPEGEYYICLFCLGVYSKYGVTSVRLT